MAPNVARFIRLAARQDTGPAKVNRPDSAMTDDENPKTTTILTVELPLELGERLRMALTRRGRPHRSLTEVTLEALEAWLEREEQNAVP